MGDRDLALGDDELQLAPGRALEGGAGLDLDPRVAHAERGEPVADALAQRSATRPPAPPRAGRRAAARRRRAGRTWNSRTRGRR